MLILQLTPTIIDFKQLTKFICYGQIFTIGKGAVKKKEAELHLRFMMGSILSEVQLRACMCFMLKSVLTVHTVVLHYSECQGTEQIMPYTVNLPYLSEK